MRSTYQDHRRNPAQRGRKGSVLVIALMMAAILGTVLGSYLNMALNQLKLANEQKYKLEAQRRVEAGAEMGLYALNNEFPNITGTPGTYSGVDGTWTLNYGAETATLVVTESLDGNRTAYTTVVVENFLRARDADDDILAGITAETVIKDDQGNLEHRRRITTDLEPRSYMPYGITAKEFLYPVWQTLRSTGFEPRTEGGYGIMVGGSYDYLYDDDIGTTNDRMVIGAGRLYTSSSGALDLYGKLITADPDNDVISNNTKVLDDYSADPENNPLDYGLYYEGFLANFPNLEPDNQVNNNVIDMPSSWTTQNLGQTPDSGYDASTGIYHYTLSNDGSDTDLDIGWGQKIQVFGPTVLYVPNDLSLDYGEIVVKSGGSLTLFVEDDLEVYYGSIINETADPSKLTVVSTQTSNSNTASWTFYQDQDFHGSLYGNRVNLLMVGKEWGLSGEYYGAAMVENLYSYGSLEFYYDKNLFRNFVRNNQSLDHELKFTPVSWTEENSDDYLAGDPSP